MEAVGFILVEAEADDFLKLEVEVEAQAATILPLPDTLPWTDYQDPKLPKMGNFLYGNHRGSPTLT